MLRYFASGADKPLLKDSGEIQRIFRNRCWRNFFCLVAVALGMFGFAISGLVVFLAGLKATDILLQDRFSILDRSIDSEYFAGNDRLECKST